MSFGSFKAALPAPTPSMIQEANDNKQFTAFTKYIRKGDIDLTELLRWGRDLLCIEPETSMSIALEFVKQFNPPNMSPAKIKNFQSDIIQINANLSVAHNVTIRGDLASDDPTQDELSEFTDIHNFLNTVDGEIVNISGRLGGCLPQETAITEEMQGLGMVIKLPITTLWFTLLAMCVRIDIGTIVQKETLEKFELVIEKILGGMREMMREELSRLVKEDEFSKILEAVVTKVLSKK